MFLSPVSSQYVPLMGFQFQPDIRITISPLKTEFLLNNIYKFSSYLTENTLRLRYKDQTLNAVQGKKTLFIVRTIRNAQIHSVGRIYSNSVRTSQETH
jgi:hypothetical protein